MSLDALLYVTLTVLGVAFLGASVRLFAMFVRFVRMRSHGLLTWRRRNPRYYGLLLAIGLFMGALTLFNTFALHRPATHVFGEGMMFMYYTVALPLSLTIRRGFYQDGIWGDEGFVPYSAIAGFGWREGTEITLVLVSRAPRPFDTAPKLVVPGVNYGEARRLLRDKIKAHAIQPSKTPLDLNEANPLDGA